jgi:RNA polymerase sigma-70 factor (ECF subfamily)
MPAKLRHVIVLRDVEGKESDTVRRELNVSPEEERALLQKARSLLRARLERYIEGAGSTN